MPGELFLLAVTGSLGCGKSRVSRWLAEQGARLLDADQDARAVLEPGSPGWQAVLAHFGPEVLAGDGPQPPLDRRLLGEKVFRDPDARAALEAIVHPRIYQRQAQTLDQWHQATPIGTTTLVVAEIPLLFETANYHELVQRTLVVDCEENTQILRTMQRSMLSENEVRAIMAQQIPRAERLRLADDTIWNDAGLEGLKPQVAHLNRRYSEISQEAIDDIGSSPYITEY